MRRWIPAPRDTAISISSLEVMIALETYSYCDVADSDGDGDGDGIPIIIHFDIQSTKKYCGVL